MSNINTANIGRSIVEAAFEPGTRLLEPCAKLSAALCLSRGLSLQGPPTHFLSPRMQEIEVRTLCSYASTLLLAPFLGWGDEGRLKPPAFSLCLFFLSLNSGLFVLAPSHTVSWWAHNPVTLCDLFEESFPSKVLPLDSQ